MILLDQFIEQTGKQPTDWNSQDIENYVNYIQAHVAEVLAVKRRDN
jgi:hypothetical protein